MSCRHWNVGIVGTIGIALAALSGCSVINPPLTVPDGSSQVCQNLAPSATDTEPIWFGIPVANTGSGPIALTAVQVSTDTDSATVLDTMVTNGGIGTAGDLASEAPDLWAQRQPVDGFVLQPGQEVSINLQVTRTPGAEAAVIPSQEITYRVVGEPFARSITSWLEIGIAADCEALWDSREPQ